jgi:hypothetical protein
MKPEDASAGSDRDAVGRAWRVRVGGRAELRFDEADGVAHGREARRDAVGNPDVEPLLARHEDLDGVEAVGAQVLGQPGIVGDPRFVDSKARISLTFAATSVTTRSSGRGPQRCYATSVPPVPAARCVFEK